MRKLFVCLLVGAAVMGACTPVVEPETEFSLPQDKEQCATQPDLPWCE